MYPFARAIGGRESVLTLESTLVPSFSTTRNLPVAFTHPAGAAPTGVFSKSSVYGTWAATRTRARAVRLPALAATVPCWLGSLPRVTVAPVPSDLTSAARAGGAADPFGAVGGTGG